MPRMPPAESLKPLARVIENETHLAAAWLRRHRLEAALTRAVCAHLPRLIAGQVRVTDLKDGQLELTVPSGALAAAVRQRTPELLIALASQSHEFNGIRVRVQPAAAVLPIQPAPVRRPPPNAVPLEALARNLPESPLKKAIYKLIKRR